MLEKKDFVAVFVFLFIALAVAAVVYIARTPAPVAREAELARTPEESSFLVPTAIPTLVRTAIISSMETVVPPTETPLPPASTSAEMPSSSTAIPTDTPPPPTAAPTDTPLLPTPVPPSPTICHHDMHFVADVTIPDDTVLLPDTGFIKTWRIGNSGNCPWPAGANWIFVDGNRMDGPSAVPVLVTNPGETTDVSVSLIAPGTPGTHTAYWTLRLPEGSTVGQRCLVRIVVPAPTPTAESSTPLVILMDRFPGMVHLNAGILADLPVEIREEITNSDWDDEEFDRIRSLDPDLVVIHWSALYFPDLDLPGDFYKRLDVFMDDHMQNTRAKFLFYTSATDAGAAMRMYNELNDKEQYPYLSPSGRLYVLAIAQDQDWDKVLKGKVETILKLP